MKSKFFTIQELACKCCGQLTINQKLVYLLDTIRYALNKPVTLTSAYRCEHHNKEVGGSPKSQHVLGNAADISCGASEDKFHIISIAIKGGATGIGVAKNFVHIDMRIGAKSFWTYPLDSAD